MALAHYRSVTKEAIKVHVLHMAWLCHQGSHRSIYTGYCAVLTKEAIEVACVAWGHVLTLGHLEPQARFRHGEWRAWGCSNVGCNNVGDLGAVTVQYGGRTDSATVKPCRV